MPGGRKGPSGENGTRERIRGRKRGGKTQRFIFLFARPTPRQRKHVNTKQFCVCVCVKFSKIKTIISADQVSVLFFSFCIFRYTEKRLINGEGVGWGV